MTSTTVNGRWTTHPWLVAGAIAGLGVTIGLVAGIVLGTQLAGATQPTVAQSVSAEPALPSSAPGNPYVNLHVPFRAPVEQAAAPSSVTIQRVLPSSAPGNPYVNIHVPFRDPVDLTPRSAAGS
jgi:hypothetical protein